MLKSVLIIFLFVILFSSCHHDDNKVIIEGEILNLTSTSIILSFHNNDSIVVDTIPVDTSSLDNKGKFSFVQHIDTNRILTLYFDDFQFSTVIFLEKDVNKIRLRGDANLPDLIEVKGGEINDNISLFKKENETALKQRSLLISEIDSKNEDSFNPTNAISEKEQNALLNSLNHELAQKVEDFILLYPDKIASVILINEFFKNNENPKNLNRVLEYLKDDASEYPLTHKLKNFNEKLMLSTEGAMMPSFSLTDKNGKNIYSTDFNNKYLLISFLSANDPKSKNNLSVLKDEYSHLNKDSIEFLSIYIDSDTFPIISTEIDSIPWKVVVENKSWSADIVELYNVNYLPYNILINYKGEIETRDTPVGEVRSIIESQSDKPKS